MRRFVLSVTILSMLFSCASVYGHAAALSESTSVYTCHANDKQKIAITFDDGPHPKYTPEILDILAEYDARATFFLIGENAEKYPELLARILREGHEIGNHTYLHADLRKTSSAKIKEEILCTERIILERTDQRPKLLRPPGGLYDKHVCEAAQALDYEVILWTIDTLDWSHPSVEEIVEKVEANIKSGDIILCHDFIGGGSTPTPDALRRILPDLLREGYEFVTVSELIHSK